VTRVHVDGNEDQHLDDDEILRRERSHHSEYHRVWDSERGQMQTTYNLLPKRGLLVRAWERWRKTRSAATERGLTIPK